MRRFWLVILLVVSQFLSAFSLQKDTTQYIIIEHADVVKYDEELYGPGVQLLKGNVLLEHQGAYISCDSAFFNGQDNSFRAYGNVHAFQGDSIQMCSDKMVYDGAQRILKATDRVVVYESRLDLYTDTVYYYRDSSLVTYPSYGKVIDSSNVLVSSTGEYWMNKNTFEFKDDAILTNPQCTVYTDLITYHTVSGLAALESRSKIVGKGSVSYTDLGKYYSNDDKMHMSGNIEHHFEEYITWADSAYAVYQPSTVGTYYDNIEIWDSINDSHIYADTLHLYKDKDSFSLLGTPTLVKELESENMYLHADTIIGYRDLDSARQIDMFPQTKIFKSNFSAKSQEIHMNERTRQMTLVGEPVIWPDIHQVTGERIVVQMYKDSNAVDSFYVENRAYLINQDIDTANYNQIKGRLLRGNIVDGDVSDIYVDGNGEIFYFVRDRQEQMMGVYKVKSSSIYAKFQNSKIDSYRLDNNPKGELSPLEDVPENTRKLIDFNWRRAEKPMSPYDIYYWDSPTETKRHTLPTTKSTSYK